MVLLEALNTSFHCEEKPQPDESRAHLVNVLLRSARRMLASPEDERASFVEGLDCFLLGIGQAQTTLEELHEVVSGEDSVSLELAHESLSDIERAAERLRFLPRQDDRPHALVDSVASELKEPVSALLSFTTGVEQLSQIRDYRTHRKLTPDFIPEAKPGELVSVPALISRLLSLCHQVAQDPTDKSEWLEVLDELLLNYNKAHQKAIHASTRVGFEEAVHLQSMSSGLAQMLAGFERLKRFRVEHDATHLDEGWVQMMKGLAQVRHSGRSLAGSFVDR